MKLSELFLQCLKIPYVSTGVSADYAVQRNGETLYLFFEGSNGINDWKSNINFPAKPYKRMGKTVWFAHSGFLKVWKEIEPHVKEHVLEKSVKKIIIAGYSHGAAIASLCHEYCWYNRPDIREKIYGYGFGSPRVFWGLKSKSVRKRWKNFTVIRNGNDIVTHLPPILMCYSHVGKMLKIGKDGNYTAISSHYSLNILKELRKEDSEK